MADTAIDINPSPLPKMNISNWLDAVIKLGVSAALAVGLTWFVTQGIKTDLLDMRVAHASAALQQMEATTINKAILDEMKTIQRTLMAMCIEAAQTNEARAACIQ